MSNGFNPGEALQRAFIDPDTPVDEPPTILTQLIFAVFTKYS